MDPYFNHRLIPNGSFPTEQPGEFATNPPCLAARHWTPPPLLFLRRGVSAGAPMHPYCSHRSLRLISLDMPEAHCLPGVGACIQVKVLKVTITFGTFTTSGFQHLFYSKALCSDLVMEPVSEL